MSEKNMPTETEIELGRVIQAWIIRHLPGFYDAAWASDYGARVAAAITEHVRALIREESVR